MSKLTTVDRAELLVAIRKCRVEDAPARLIHERDENHVLHMIEGAVETILTAHEEARMLDRLEAAEAKVARVEALAELLIEQGDEHVAGCMGQADCAACIHADLRAALRGDA